MSSLVTFMGHLRSGRISNIASAIARRLPNWLFRYSSGSIFEFEYKATGLDKSSIRSQVVFQYRQATESDMVECAKEAGATIFQLKSRLEAGNLCYLIMKADRVACQMWVHWGDCFIRGAGYFVSANSDVAYVYGIVTSADFRGKGLYKNGLRLLEQTLRDNEATRILQFVEKSNNAVMHTLPEIGYERLVEVFHLRLMGIGMTRATSCADRRTSWNFFLREKKSAYII